MHLIVWFSNFKPRPCKFLGSTRAPAFPTFNQSKCTARQLNDWGHANLGGGSYNNKRNNTYTERWKVNHSQILHMIQDEIPRIFWLYLFVNVSCKLHVFSTVQHFHSHFPQYPIPPYYTPYQSQALLLWVSWSAALQMLCSAMREAPQHDVVCIGGKL